MDSANVMIHVRFAPNGTVIEISERPPGVSPQDWFILCAIRLVWSIRRFLAARRVSPYTDCSGRSKN